MARMIFCVAFLNAIVWIGGAVGFFNLGVFFRNLYLHGSQQAWVWHSLGWAIGVPLCAVFVYVVLGPLMMLWATKGKW